MEKIKIILVLLLIISLTGITTADETLYFDYESSVENSYTIRPSSATLGPGILNKLYTPDVSKIKGLKYLVTSATSRPPDKLLYYTDNYPATKTWSRDSYFTMTIDGQIVGNGILSITCHYLKEVKQGYTISYTFNNINVEGMTGAKTISLSFADEDLPLTQILTRSSASITTLKPEEPIVYLKLSTGSYATYLEDNIWSYYEVDFHQTLTYNTNNDKLNINYIKNGISNKIKFIDNKNTIRLESDSNLDISVSYPYTPYLDVEIDNNFLPTAENPFWTLRLPEEGGGEILGKTKVTYKLVDTTRPYITLRGVYQIWEYHPDTDTFTDYDIGNINGETDIYFDTGKTYSIEFTNNDYKPFKIDYHKKIELVSKNNVIEMEKDEGDNITVSFRAENMDYGKSDNKYPHQYFRDFSITKNGETKYSNNAGYIFYENITPQEFNIIAKTAGYDDYHKNYGVLDKTQLITVPLKSEGNYKFLSLKAYNGNNPSQTVATNYKIYVTKNGIETLLIETESMQGAFVYYLEVGFLHRVEYSSYGFKSGEIVFNPFFMDVVEKIYLYPEEEGINTLVFEIVDSKNIPSYGVRVAIGEEIKYTDTNGKTSFALPQGPVTYEIYKQGYQKIGNSFNLTEDHLLKITLLKDGEVPPSTTPEIPPTEVKPSNIIESVKYAFSKMFGFNYNNPEDITKNNLLFGLIIVLGVATVVAGVTKDGLGALVGGAIGFVFSSALGLIPIWVLLTGFAFIAIYIILFRISNDGGN